MSKTNCEPCFGVRNITWPRLLRRAPSHSSAPGAPRSLCVGRHSRSVCCQRTRVSDISRRGVYPLSPKPQNVWPSLRITVGNNQKQFCSNLEWIGIWFCHSYLHTEAKKKQPNCYVLQKMDILFKHSFATGAEMRILEEIHAQWPWNGLKGQCWPNCAVYPIYLHRKPSVWDLTVADFNLSSLRLSWLLTAWSAGTCTHSPSPHVCVSALAFTLGTVCRLIT